jgi:hypothetical protein
LFCRIKLYSIKYKTLKQPVIFCRVKTNDIFYLHLIFETSILRTWFLNLIFCLFRTGFLHATQAVKIKFKNQVQKSISWTRDFKHQVQIDRGIACFQSRNISFFAKQQLFRHKFYPSNYFLFHCINERQNSSILQLLSCRKIFLFHLLWVRILLLFMIENKSRLVYFTANI